MFKSKLKKKYWEILFKVFVIEKKNVKRNYLFDNPFVYIISLLLAFRREKVSMSERSERKSHKNKGTIVEKI